MKKLLLISYYFPPSGGPGVQRVLKFVKYLPEFGWHPVVLTVQDGDFPARDESLLAEVPRSVTVYRTKILEPYRIYRRLTGRPANAPVDVENIPQAARRRSAAEAVAEFIRSTLFIPDARIGWYQYAVRKGMEIIAEEKIDALYSSSPPYTSALIARGLKRRTGLPWVAGFRDPWTEFLSTPHRWFIPKMIDRSFERSVLDEATYIEAAWAGIIKDFRRKFPDADLSKCIHIPNGFDPDDYPSLKRIRNRRFTVVYTGSMYGKRNPKGFLAAVDDLVRTKKVDPKKIHLKFIGRFGSEVLEMLQSSLLRESIEIVSYLPHSKSIRELMRADMLLLVVDEAKESGEIVPGKVFEYIGADRPILALAPEGAVAELLRETGAGLIAHNQDIQGIKRAFLECYRNFLYHRKNVRLNRKAIKRYDRKQITSQLAQLLDSATNAA